MSDYVGPERRSTSRIAPDDRDIDLEMIDRRLTAVEMAFPDGPERHRDYHQAKINSAKEEAEFWKTAKIELTKAGVSTLVGVLKTILVLALVGLLYKLGLGAVAAALVK